MFETSVKSSVNQESQLIIQPKDLNQGQTCLSITKVTLVAVGIILIIAAIALAHPELITIAYMNAHIYTGVIVFSSFIFSVCSIIWVVKARQINQHLQQLTDTINSAESAKKQDSVEEQGQNANIHKSDAITQLKDELATAQLKIDELKQGQALISDASTQLKDELATAQLKIDAVKQGQAPISDLNELGTSSGKTDKKEKEITDLKEEIAKLQQQIENLSKDKDPGLVDDTKNKQQVESLKVELSKCLKTIEELTKNLENANKEKEKLVNLEKSPTDKEIQQVKEQKQKIENLQIQVNDLSEKNKKLKQECEDAKKAAENAKNILGEGLDDVIESQKLRQKVELLESQIIRQERLVRELNAKQALNRTLETQKKSQMSNSQLGNSLMFGTDLNKSMMSGTDLNKSMMSGTDLNKSMMSGTDLNKSMMFEPGTDASLTDSFIDRLVETPKSQTLKNVLGPSKKNTTQKSISKKIDELDFNDTSVIDELLKLDTNSMSLEQSILVAEAQQATADALTQKGMEKKDPKTLANAVALSVAALVNTQVSLEKKQRTQPSVTLGASFLNSGSVEALERQFNQLNVVEQSKKVIDEADALLAEIEKESTPKTNSTPTATASTASKTEITVELKKNVLNDIKQGVTLRKTNLSKQQKRQEFSEPEIRALAEKIAAVKAAREAALKADGIQEESNKNELTQSWMLSPIGNETTTGLVNVEKRTFEVPETSSSPEIEKAVGLINQVKQLFQTRKPETIEDDVEEEDSDL